MNSSYSSQIEHCPFDNLLTAKDIYIAELHWIYSKVFLQRLNICNQSKSQSDCVLISCLDESSIVRCKGRINNLSLPLKSMNPIILPHNHYVTELLIHDFHNKVKHSGVNDT